MRSKVVTFAPGEQQHACIADRRKRRRASVKRYGVRLCVGACLIAVSPTLAASSVSRYESAPSCLDWLSPDTDIIEGRFLEYGHLPNIHYAMAQVELGLGVVRTAIELSWRINGIAHVQTLVDVTTSGDFAGGVSFYRADDMLNTEYLQCGWDNHACSPQMLKYRYDAANQQFVGDDEASSDALIHLCTPVYFDSERALRRTRR